MLSAISTLTGAAGMSARSRTASVGASFDQALEQATSATDLATALADFRKEATLTPAQRARRDILKSMDLTEDALKAMPPDQRHAIEQKIAAAVTQRLKLQQEQRTGFGGGI